MAEQKGPYRKAPIIEAVIDLRVELPEGTSVEVFRGLQARLPDTYGPPQDLYETTLEFRPGSSTPVRGTVPTHRGFRFERADGRRVLQAKLDNFSYSVLPPYDEWDGFRDEAKAMWEFYRDACHPTHVIRVAVRYINQIDIPLKHAAPKGSFQLQDYFTTYPHITDGLAHSAMAGFIMQVSVPQPDLNSMLLLKQAVVSSPSPEVLSVLLDLDLFRDVRWDAGDDHAVWGFLEQLRVRKNEAFEASITDNTRELFN